MDKTRATWAAQDIRGMIDSYIASLSDENKKRIAEWCFLKSSVAWAEGKASWQDTKRIPFPSPESAKQQLDQFESLHLKKHLRDKQQKIQTLHESYLKIKMHMADSKNAGGAFHHRELISEEYPAWPYVM